MEKDVYELTNAQKSIWNTELFYKGTNINSICGTAIINEPINIELLQNSIKHVVKNNKSFGLKIIIDNNIAKQYFSNIDCDIDIVNVNSIDEMNSFRKEFLKKPFTLESSSLFKFYIFKFPNDYGAFMLNIHHLIADAWTLGLICNEIIENYSNLKNDLPTISYNASYFDYIISEQKYLNSNKFQKDMEYWNSIFSKIPEVATLPGTSGNKMSLGSCLANRKVQKIDKTLIESIRAFCKKHKVSVFNFFMAVFGLYIGRASNLDDFIIGTPILNRYNYNDKNSSGMYISTIPFKIHLSNNITFNDFVTLIARDSLTMLRHQKYPYQKILEDLRKENKNIPNLYSVLLSYQITNAKNNESNIDYTTEWSFNGNCSDPINIHLDDINDTGELNISYDYQTAIYTASDINSIHNRILNIIEQVLSLSSIKLKDIDIVTPDEKQKILFNFNKTDFSYNDTLTVVDLFEEQVHKTPHKIALISNNISFSYEQLNKKSNILAYYLKNTCHVKEKDIIGIMLNRTPEMIIGLLAILKCGAAYLPIDPEYPRRTYFLYAGKQQYKDSSYKQPY